MPPDSGSPTATALQVSDLPPLPDACVPTAAQIVAGPPLSPAKRIWLYDSGEWEVFVLEWAHAVKEPYVHVQRLGGSGDHGMDVAAFLTSRGLEGDWDCFQCKHYSGTLTPADAWPEILKILTASLDGYCTLPRRYLFFSPKGCGPKLAKLLNSPKDLKTTFLAELAKSDGLGKGLTDERIAQLTAYAADVDFAIFGDTDLEDVLTVHRRTPYHSLRFGWQLPHRPQPEEPPGAPTKTEHRYVEQLIEVYSERHPDAGVTPNNASEHPLTKKHFPRQREAFYCAESLRVFARDSVPEGTFKKLQDDLYDGVVEVEDLEHQSGHH
jgi:hypothetical protein